MLASSGIHRNRQLACLGVFILAFGLLMFGSKSAWAQACSVTGSPASANFGALSSFAIENTIQQVAAQPGTGLRCQGSLLGLIYSGDYLNAVLSSSNSNRLKNLSGDSISYQIFADQNYQDELYIGTAYNYYNGYLLGLLGLLGGSAANMPIYFRLPAAATQNLAVGLYTDTINIAWDWSICTGIGLLGICLGHDTGSASSQVNIILEILPDCVIDAPDVDFGSAPLVLAFAPVVQTISVRCSKGQHYTVGLSDGQYAAGNQRRLQYNNNYLNYEIFKSTSGNIRWGKQGADRRADTEADINQSVIDGVSTQGFHYQVVIDPNQSTPPPGQYSDSIVVDVAF